MLMEAGVPCSLQLASVACLRIVAMPLHSSLDGVSGFGGHRGGAAGHHLRVDVNLVYPLQLSSLSSGIPCFPGYLSICSFTVLLPASSELATSR